jgi:opacity protein-like surface antigen
VATERDRFTGGHVRARLSPRTAIELSIDRRTGLNTAGSLRTREYPVQASLLVFPVRSVFSPYLLGGGGWYTSRFDSLHDDVVIASETERGFGWHAGFGAELQLGRHAAVHADYRYTRLQFGDEGDDVAGDEDEGGFSRFLPSYQGSMWTAGLTVYF